MDLRPFNLTDRHREVAAHLLNYQPFIISDDLQTGIAHSWLHVDDVEGQKLGSYPLMLDRNHASPAQWDAFVDANARLRTMYDDWIRLLAQRYPGGTMLDVACNNGYFPVRAEMFGMAPSFGLDLSDGYAASMGFLNILCGTHAGFFHAPYDPVVHTSGLKRQFDVVVASNILPHLPDPTHFIGFLGRMAKEAVFLWTGMLDTDEMLVLHRRPTASWSAQGPARPEQAWFPNMFNRGALVSRGLVEYAFEAMGFRTVTVLPWAETWLPNYNIIGYEPPVLTGDVPPLAAEGFKLINEIKVAAKSMAVLATR